MKYNRAMNEQNTVTCSSVLISKQRRVNVEQKKSSTKRIHIARIYLIKVQKQEKIVVTHGGKAMTWKGSQVHSEMFVMFSLLIWELVTPVCSVCENL